jgi:transcriptional regulator with XRE-family HTH domain
MLNITAIEVAMRKLGLNGTALADACQVSKEATSNWLKGESIPRPSKLTKLAEVLKLSVDDLLEVSDVPEPLFAYRTKRNLPVTGPAREAAEELARHLRQLLPYVEDRSDFEPPLLRAPSLDDERIRSAANTVRSSLGLVHSDALTNGHMEGLFRTFGAVLVPVLWGLNKEKHENALTVYLPDSKTSWVVFNLGCKQDDYKYWLAHEYGHCLTLHALSEDDGEKFAEAFAQHLLFPLEAAQECLEAIQKSARPMQEAEKFAARHDISIVTVVKAVDRLSTQMYGKETELASRSFWAAWSVNRSKVPSMALGLFGTDTPTSQDYISKVEAAYGTPVFKALAEFQRAEGGRNPAFIANALKIGLGNAVGLSYTLWQYQT